MKYFSIFCIIVAVLVGFFVALNEKRDLQEEKNQMSSVSLTTKRTLKVAERILSVEIADTDEKRAQGLSYRKSLGEDEGMFFVFDKEGDYPFWMKNMNFPIDIAWIDKTLKIIHIEHNISPSTYPEAFTSPTAASYVLETNANFFLSSKIKIGDMIEF